MFDYKQLSFLLGTQTRARTGMGFPTGVWDQRVYRFRHLGLISGAKVIYFLELAKFYLKNIKILAGAKNIGYIRNIILNL